MKKFSVKFLIIITLSLLSSVPAYSQINWGRALKSAYEGFQALTISDEQMAAYVRESVDYMDRTNKVLPEDSKYTQRLRRLTKGITTADGIPLNFKAYETADVNAFACPDGSVRVFSGLMDIMDDDELMGVIGHEIGHVLKHHSRKAFQQQLLTGALKDALAASSGKIAMLTDSQLGTLSETFLSAKFSRKQETEADDCGYDFLKTNGRNPLGMASAFEKLDAIEQQGGARQSYIAKMFSSHPDTKSRIKHIRQRAAKDKIK